MFCYLVSWGEGKTCLQTELLSVVDEPKGSTILYTSSRVLELSFPQDGGSSLFREVLQVDLHTGDEIK